MMSPFHMLASWPYFTPETSQLLPELPSDSEILIDCGAFTRWRAGAAPASLGSYLDFIDTLGSIACSWRYFQLDVIGDANATLANLRSMIKRGYSPIPIYTRGAPVAHLDEMLELAPIVALGGISRSSGERPHGYLSRLANTYDMQRFHILGFTQARWLPLYRPASVDSSSWIGAGRYGRAVFFEKPFSTTTCFVGTRLTPSQTKILRDAGASVAQFMRPENWTGGLGIHNMVTAYSWLRLGDVAHANGTQLYYVVSIPCELKRLLELYKVRDILKAVRAVTAWQEERRICRTTASS